MRVLLLVDTLPVGPDDPLARSIAAIQQAIDRFSISAQTEIAIVAAKEAIDFQAEDILCPLTLNLPDSLEWNGQAIYQACRDVEKLRDRVSQKLSVPAATGEFWLPIVLTAKGPLYAEAICRENSVYYQPLYLSDRHRQPLYRLAHSLLRNLKAPPAVYLLQFGWTDGKIGFDRLFPFPTEVAIASLNVQTSDLFACHWQCLTRQPILDVQIPGNVEWRSIVS